MNTDDKEIKCIFNKKTIIFNKHQTQTLTNMKYTAKKYLRQRNEI